MAGRRPKPTALKAVTGNPGKRKLNAKEPQPARTIPSPPDHLTDAAKVAWGRLTVLLDRMGVLTEADTYALERLCDVYAEILECRRIIARDGRTYTSIKMTGDYEDAVEQTLIKAHPAVAMLADADRRFKSYLVEFGLTPAARTKVTISDGEKEADPLQQFFAG